MQVQQREMALDSLIEVSQLHQPINRSCPTKEPNPAYHRGDCSYTFQFFLDDLFDVFGLTCIP